MCSYFLQRHFCHEKGKQNYYKRVDSITSNNITHISKAPAECEGETIYFIYIVAIKYFSFTIYILAAVYKLDVIDEGRLSPAPNELVLFTEVNTKSTKSQSDIKETD